MRSPVSSDSSAFTGPGTVAHHCRWCLRGLNDLGRLLWCCAHFPFVFDPAFTQNRVAAMSQPLPAAILVPIQESLTCQLVGFTLATTLFGITLLQGYLYYRNYGKDTMKLKTLVGILVILDTLTTILMAQSMYTYIVTDFGDPLKIAVITWGFSLENGLSVLTAFIVQCYFAQRLWVFSRHNIALVAGIVILAVGNIACGEAITARLYIDPSVFSLGSTVTRVLSGVSNGFSAACDALIAFGLCFYLENGRSGLQKTDKMVDKLMVYAINRGALTTVCQTLHLILTVAFPGRYLFLPFAMMESKLYVNALLATLNVRNSLTGSNALELGSTVMLSTNHRSRFESAAANANSVPFEERSVATIEFAAPRHGAKRLDDMEKNASPFTTMG
ncbi:hypothetical protein C2E23DRAFT_851778 [Lenzites betulinus]|nr:hypothetical protein C2E23DRAFT_851778 [Lenzites betulinus]